MKGIIIIAGFGFPYAVIDEGFSWAQQNQAALKAILITSDGPDPEDYPFPNDLGEVRAEQPDIAPGPTEQQLSRDQVRWLQDRARTAAIVLTGVRLRRPSLKKVLQHCAGADRIFLDTAPEDQEFLLEGIRFSKEALIAGIDQLQANNRS